MKRIIYLSFAIVSCFSLFQSCTKDRSNVGINDHSSLLARLNPTVSIGVGEFGWPIFEDRNDILQVREFLEAGVTHEDAQKFFDEFNFEYPAQNFFAESLADTVDFEDFEKYFFDIEGIVQVENVLFKLNGDFLLCMLVENLETDRYEELKAGNYNSEYMVLLDDDHKDEEMEIIDFVNETVSDYEGIAGKRPFGRHYNSNQDVACCHGSQQYIFRYYTTHFFFFQTGEGYKPMPVGPPFPNPCGTQCPLEMLEWL